MTNTSTPSDANQRQVGGGHYRKQKIQHWDYVIANDLDYFQGQITKYVSRWKDKNGIEDLLKAQHFLEKYIQSEMAKRHERIALAQQEGEPSPHYVNQDQRQPRNEDPYP